MARRIELAVVALMTLAAACNRTPTPGLARGEALYATCGKCHGDAGQGDQTLGAPSIGGLPAWYVEEQLTKFAAGHRGYDPFDTNGIRMKSVAWTLDREGDVPSVSQYVATLEPGRATPVLSGGDASAGAADFAICSACHGANAEGNEAVHAPPLAGRSDWYLFSQLRKFQVGMRGTRPEDIWGQTMRPQAMMIDDSTITRQRVLNVVAYISTLGANTAAR